MQSKDDVSYGVIPLIKEGDTWKVFLINQYGCAGDIYWTFPKGHKEVGESDEESALRELYEESGLVPERLLVERSYEQSYSFLYEGVRINKKVVYYVGLITSKVFSVQVEEVKEAGWFSFKEAQERLSHDKAKMMLVTIEADMVGVVQ